MNRVLFTPYLVFNQLRYSVRSALTVVLVMPLALLVVVRVVLVRIRFADVKEIDGS